MWMQVISVQNQTSGTFNELKSNLCTTIVTFTWVAKDWKVFWGCAILQQAYSFSLSVFFLHFSILTVPFYKQFWPHFSPFYTGIIWAKHNLFTGIQSSKHCKQLCQAVQSLTTVFSHFSSSAALWRLHLLGDWHGFQVDHRYALWVCCHRSKLNQYSPLYELLIVVYICMVKDLIKIIMLK